jgi:hypothetical protein
MVASKKIHTSKVKYLNMHQFAKAIPNQQHSSLSYPAHNLKGVKTPMQ